VEPGEGGDYAGAQAPIARNTSEEEIIKTLNC